LIAVRIGAEEILVDLTRDVSWFNGFPVYEHVFWVNSTNVHLTAVVME
jgi:hypothetical protein